MYAIILTIANCCSPWFNNWLNRTAHAHMREVDIANFQRAIAQNPDNAAAHEYLGDALMELRRYDEAIAAYKTVMSLAKRATTNEQWKLQRALAAKERRWRRPTIACHHCDAVHPAGTEICPLCGAPLQHGLPARLISLCSPRNEGNGPMLQLLGNFAIVLPVLFILFSPLPLLAKVWMLFLGVIVGGYFLLKSVGHD